MVTHTAGWLGDLEVETDDGDDALARYIDQGVAAAAGWADRC